MFGSHAVNDCRVSRSSRFTLTLPHLCLHTLTPHISSCYDRVFVYIVYCRGKSCIGPHFLFLEGSSLENANSFALLFFLFSPFSAHDTKCLIWTRLKMLQGIVRILFSVSHWFQINIYKHRWSMRRRGLWVFRAPFVHTSLQFVSLCEYALFRNCFGVYRHYANQLWSFQ